MRKNDKPKSTSLVRRIASAASIIVFFLVLTSVTRGVYRLASSGGKISEANEKLSEVKAQQERLKHELSEVQSEYYQEKQARDKLGLAREGEIVVVLPEESVLRRLSPRKLKNSEFKLPEQNWEKWASLFFEF